MRRDRHRLDFIVNVALDRESRPVAVAAGDVDQAHQELVAFLRRHFGVPALTRPPAVIVTGTGAPLDINLYQTIKALVGIEPLLDGARSAAQAPVVVLLSRCWDGDGSDEMFEPFTCARERLQRTTGDDRPSDARRAEAIEGCLQDDYTIERDESYLLARATPKCRAVVACCPGVSDEELRLLGWEPAASADAAMARALQIVDKTAAPTARGGPGGRDSGRLVVMCPHAQRALFSSRRGSPSTVWRPRRRVRSSTDPASRG